MCHPTPPWIRRCSYRFVKTVRADEKSEGRDTVMREHVSIFVFDLQGSVARRHLELAVEVSLGRGGDLDV